MTELLTRFYGSRILRTCLVGSVEGRSAAMSRKVLCLQIKGKPQR